jgi:hypothetical protein
LACFSPTGTHPSVFFNNKIIPLSMRNRFTLLALLAAFAAQAQISEGGLPPSFLPENQLVLNRTLSGTVDLPSLDVAVLRAEDSRTPGQNRFAAPVAADVSPANAGIWDSLADGSRVWRCALRSPGALGLTLLFDGFRLAPGARFFAYSAERRRVLGAYTSESCLPDGQFLVGVLPGETAHLELVEPAHARAQSSLHVWRVDVAYESEATAAALDFGNSLACHNNVNCTLGNDWQVQKKGVARILMVFSNGEGWCSGTLIANTAGTFEPYFLTAHHCQLIGSNPNFSLWRFDFDYESPTCANPATEPMPRSVLGCERVAFRQETDFMLLRMNAIPTNYDVYFNGWNRDNNTTTVPPSTTFIHHPVGDIKKISVDNQAATIQASVLNWGSTFGTSPANSHWKTITDLGTFEPGSSGSALFDTNKRIVGQLHGGSWSQQDPTCTVTGAYFGRFNLSWSQGTTSASRLREWLDPSNLGPTTQNGYPRPVVQSFSVSGHVATHWGAPMRGVRLSLVGGTTNASALTDSLGNFQFGNVPGSQNYTLTPTLDTNDVNGVSTQDLVLVSKHLLGTETLDSPWKIIAADANGNNAVTAFDIVEARKVILGINEAFPSNTSWRFFPANSSFSDPTNPFASALPPNGMFIGGLQSNFNNANFKALKVADVNNSASPSN